MQCKNKLCVAVAVLLLVACGKKADAPGAHGAPPPMEVEVLAIKPGDADVSEELPGRLQAYRSAQVRARVEGILEKRIFTEGSDVSAGQLLYKLESDTYRANIASAEAEVSAAKATVDRYTPLAEMKAVSQQELDQAVANLKKGEASLARAKLDLNNANVVAPISGRIGQSLVSEGALVGKGEATPLATIEQVDPIYVNFNRTSSELTALRQAVTSGKAVAAQSQQVQILMDDGSIYPYPGKLLFSDASVDPDTGSILVRALVPNPKRLLLPGMFVRVRIPTARIKGAIRVPQSVVQMNTQGAFVMTVNEKDLVTPQPIKTGNTVGKDWLVTDGLKAGDKVILTGLQKMGPGMPVKIVSSESPPAAAGDGKPSTNPPAPAQGKNNAEKDSASPGNAKDSSTKPTNEK